MSGRLGFTLLDVRNIIVHALIVAGAMVLAGLLGLLDTSVFGPYEVTATAVITAAITAIKRYIQDNTI